MNKIDAKTHGSLMLAALSSLLEYSDLCVAGGDPWVADDMDKRLRDGPHPGQS